MTDKPQQQTQTSPRPSGQQGNAKQPPESNAKRPPSLDGAHQGSTGQRDKHDR